MDDELNYQYLSAIKGFKYENEILFNSFIAYRSMIQKILDLQVHAIPGNEYDLFVSKSSINGIIKDEIEKLKEENKKFEK